MRARLIVVLISSFFFLGCGPEITVSNPLSVLNWSPHDGAAGIDVDAVPSVCLSLEIEEDSLEHAALRLGDSDVQGAPGTTDVPASIELSAVDSACIVFRPSASLAPGTTYHMVLEPGIRSSEKGGISLEVTLFSRFTTVDE